LSDICCASCSCSGVKAPANNEVPAIAAVTPPPGILLINSLKGLLTASNPLAVSIEPAIAFNG
jgi:hypothetical protein